MGPAHRANVQVMFTTMAPATLALVRALLALPSGLGELDAPPAFELAVEPNHTTIGWSVDVAGGMTRVTGKFTRFEVNLVLDERDLGACSVTASIEAASIDTGLDDRDAHLRGPDFFDAAAHPHIRFTSQRIERRGDGYAAVGELEIRGVKAPVEVPFRLTRLEREEGRPRLGIAAALHLDRDRFGVGSTVQHPLVPDFISREVVVEIFLWTKLGRPVERP